MCWLDIGTAPKFLVGARLHGMLRLARAGFPLAERSASHYTLSRPPGTFRPNLWIFQTRCRDWFYVSIRDHNLRTAPHASDQQIDGQSHCRRNQNPMKVMTEEGSYYIHNSWTKFQDQER